MTSKSFDLGAIVQIGFVSGLQVANRQAHGYVMHHAGTNNYYTFVPHKGLTRYGQTPSDFRAALAAVH
jgi:hypothetical protein